MWIADSFLASLPARKPKKTFRGLGQRSQRKRERMQERHGLTCHLLPRPSGQKCCGDRLVEQSMLYSHMDVGKDALPLWGPAEKKWDCGDLVDAERLSKRLYWLRWPENLKIFFFGFWVVNELKLGKTAAHHYWCKASATMHPTSSLSGCVN